MNSSAELDSQYGVHMGARTPISAVRGQFPNQLEDADISVATRRLALRSLGGYPLYPFFL